MWQSHEGWKVDLDRLALDLTVLREGIEAVIFVGGVSLGQPGTSNPVGMVCSLVI